MDLYDQLPNSKLTYLAEYSSILESAKEHGVTVVDLITLKPTELTKFLPRSINEIAEFQKVLKSEYQHHVFELSRPQSVSREERILFFTSGDEKIDEVLNGGIRTHGITEIFGGSSTGKTQLLMQLSLSVQAPVAYGGLNGKCVFITTEGNLPTNRLDEMITYRRQIPGFEAVSQKNIFTVSCNDLANQEHILLVQLPILMERNPEIKLIIVDSISHHLRVELESKNFRDSQENRHYVDRMAQNLLKIAAKNSLAVVVANQVGDKPLPEGSLCNGVGLTSAFDYDYQLGWTVGWRDSSVFYRQTKQGLSFDNCNADKNRPDSSSETILSDDEDYNLVAATALARKRHLDNGQSSRKTTSLQPKSNSREPTSSSLKQFAAFYGRKRQVETKIPNLGLSWANHLSTRIMLKKSYKASPLIKKGAFDLNEVLESSLFWQPHRSLTVVFSEHAKKREIGYIISPNGIQSVEAIKQLGEKT
ncbi:LADA_0F05820g1_1 [Lachancea dasiensis]|uniref:LADA_0F05820g1_1 n=1 Tax=Lachancea dasiensis TaxID=1072105 RepID=A0A1G4JJL7_9SACH|nr:LADA_0F05820g1_1 [Lachancea dasiensis]